MAYIGKSPPTSGKDAGASFDIDDISGEFNGSTTAFDIEVGGTALSPTTTNVFIFLGGVLQHPGDAYTVSGSQIAFTAAPDSGVSFHGTILGHTRTITPDQGTVADSSFAASAITAISGSFTAVSSSLASRISSEEGEAEGSVISSSAQIAADISGSITSTSSSIATRFDSRETDMTLATASIAAITASISTAKTDISTNTSNMTLATASIAAITSSVSTINSNMTLATASIAAITASVSSLKSTSFAGTAGTETVFSGSAASTGSFGSIYTDKNVNASSFVGDGSSLTGIDIPTAAAISGSVEGATTVTGSFGKMKVNNLVLNPVASASALQETGSLMFDSTDNTLRIFGGSINKGGWSNVAPNQVTGGSITGYKHGANNYALHVFKSSGLFTVMSNSVTVDMLIVGGGGSGGVHWGAGGGGAGAVVWAQNAVLSRGTYIVTVGAGGSARTSGTGQGTDGETSLFSDGTQEITGSGGGGGGGETDGRTGGSGGGSSYNGGTVGATNAPTTGSAFTGGWAGYGNAGGSGATAGSNDDGGGGGGAGAAGSAGGGGTGGDGGQGDTNFMPAQGPLYIGTVADTGQFLWACQLGTNASNVAVEGLEPTDVTGLPVLYIAGGGGGSGRAGAGGTGGAGGDGGGAKGAGRGDGNIGSNALPNTGGGGGAASLDSGGQPNDSGAGGSGVVAIRYLV